MKLRIVAVLILLAGSIDLEAALGGCTNDGTLAPYQFETITVSSTAIGFTTAKIQPSGQTPGVMAVITLATNDVRWRVDGVDPTAGVGHAFAATTSLTVCGLQSLQQFRMIRQSADATASVSYFRQGNN